MNERMEASDRTTPEVSELTSAHVGFDVVDRNGEHVGTLREVSLSRTCLVVEAGGGILRRNRSHHAVHVSAVHAVDHATSTVSLAVTNADVVDAPEFHELDPDCESALARYYGGHD